jgi:flagellar motor switch protein FliG
MLPVDEPGGARKAALLLHALPAQSREAVLQALPDEQRDTLHALLAELHALGIPPEHDWLALVDIAPQGSDDPVEQAMRLGPAQVRQCLASQSPDTVAAFIASHDWPWREALLRDWPQEQRTRLLALIDDADCLSAAMCQSVARQLVLAAASSGFAEHPASAPQPSTPRWYQRFMPASSGSTRSRP